MVKAMKLTVGNPNRKLVLLKLADNASDSGECWPSYQHIAEQCEISRCSAMNHIKKLEQDGFLKVVKRRKSATESMTNIYLLTLDRDSENISLGGETDSLGGENISLGGSETVSPRTSHYLEPVNEPKKTKAKKAAKKPAIHAVSKIERLLLAYRKSIGKPLKTRKGLKMLVNSIDSCAKQWGVRRSLVTNHLRRHEWQSINPTFRNPFQQQANFPQGVNHGNANQSVRTETVQQPSAFDQWAAEQHAELSDPNWQPDF